MAPRQDLITSAVSFLRDPSVASSPVEKRIEFLQSKNLTQEEIDLALAQANTDPNSPQPQSQSQPYYPPAQYNRPQGAYPPQGYPPYGYPPNAIPPPPPPRRDWRDYFILATVAATAGVTIYTLANRYIKPLIAPPTPPQLEQDKAAIDEQFTRAFALLETLSEDTTKLKDAEEQRTKRLDAAIGEIEAVVAELKEGNRRREDDARRVEGEVRSMKEGLPRSIDTVREASERQLKELGSELASLKTLMANRMQASASQPAPQSSYMAMNRSQSSSQQQSSSGSAYPRGTAAMQPSVAPANEPTTTAPGSQANLTGVNGSATVPSFSTPSASQQPAASSTTAKPASNLGYGASKVSIPAWQLAAQKKNDAANAAKEGTSTPVDGADAVAALQNA